MAPFARCHCIEPSPRGHKFDAGTNMWNFIIFCDNCGHPCYPKPLPPPPREEPQAEADAMIVMCKYVKPQYNDGFAGSIVRARREKGRREREALERSRDLLKALRATKYGTDGLPPREMAEETSGWAKGHDGFAGSILATMARRRAERQARDKWIAERNKPTPIPVKVAMWLIMGAWVALMVWVATHPSPDAGGHRSAPPLPLRAPAPARPVQ